MDTQKILIPHFILLIISKVIKKINILFLYVNAYKTCAHGLVIIEDLLWFLPNNIFFFLKLLQAKEDKMKKKRQQASNDF